MMDEQKTVLFEQMPVPQAIMKLAIPTVLSSLVMMLYNMADTYFVGMLNNPVQNVAVTLASPVLLSYNAFNNLFGVGCSSMMSRALGRKDYETVRQSSAFGIYCSILCGLLLSVVCTVFRQPLLGLLGANAETMAATEGYLKWTVCLGAAPAILNVVMAYLVRSEGAALHASIGTMSGCVLNMIIDPIFILPWGFNMGAAGAGLATFLSNCVACLYFFVLLYRKRKRTYISIKPKEFKLNRRIVAGVCGVGIPASIQNLLNVTGMTILNNFTSAYGADAVAAMGITQKVNMVPVQIAIGASQGIMPLISYCYASGNHKRMKEVITFALKILLPLLICVSLLFYMCAGGIIGIFMKNESIIAYGTRFLRGFCLVLPFIYVDFLSVGVFQATGKGKIALAFAIFRKILLEIPAIMILNFLFPLYGMAYAQFSAELVLSMAAVFMLKRSFVKMQREDEVSRR